MWTLRFLQSKQEKDKMRLQISSVRLISLVYMVNPINQRNKRNQINFKML
jgi:hypothetical protein